MSRNEETHLRDDAHDPDWEGVRLHVVSGKGGTGKTTVAAAFALALAAEGRHTLLIEVEGRQGIAQVFETEALPYEERKIAVAPGGGEVYALAIDPGLALLDYLEMFYKLGRAGKALQKLGAIDFATTIAPGLRDVLLTGKACEAVRRKDRSGRRIYDAVVMDAPPTGRIARFLNVNTEVAGLARFGPIYNQAQAVMRVLRSPETAVHLVTLLEEMPVQETVDGVTELRAANLPVGGVLINMVRPSVVDIDEEVVRAVEAGGQRASVTLALSVLGFGGARRDEREVPREALRAGAMSVTDTINNSGAHPGGGQGSAGQDWARGLIDPLLAQAREHAERLVLERHERKEIAELGLPAYELELLGDGVDLAGLYRLAGELREQGAA